VPRLPQEIEVERLSLAFDEDPVASFSKRKNGRGHIFIDLIPPDDRKDMNFSPCNLIEVPHAEC
jgi:hypothetical protein